MTDDETFISLRCIDCENTTCRAAKRYVPIDSLEGCTRKVSEDDAAKYYHLLEEVAPFLYIKTSKEYQSRTYKEITDFLEYIYSKPFGQKLNRKGTIRLK